MATIMVLGATVSGLVIRKLSVGMDEDEKGCERRSLGLIVWNFEFRISGVRFLVSGFGFWV